MLTCVLDGMPVLLNHAVSLNHAVQIGPAWTRTRDQPIMSRLL
jgi:hypothetical protein